MSALAEALVAAQAELPCAITRDSQGQIGSRSLQLPVPRQAHRATRCEGTRDEPGYDDEPEDMPVEAPESRQEATWLINLG